jgi:hypothetical protein
VIIPKAMLKYLKSQKGPFHLLCLNLFKHNLHYVQLRRKKELINNFSGASWLTCDGGTF